LVEDFDWLWQFGDYQIFKDSGGDVFTKTFNTYYQEVLDFIKKTPDAGVISCRGFHGGWENGYAFIRHPKNALIQAGHGGLFYQNIGIDNLIEPCEVNLLGAIEEALIGYNIMSNGFAYYRRFNSPMGNRRCTRIGEIPSYTIETINANIQGRIRDKFDDPNWNHENKKYPNAILRGMKNEK
jgi:hypothetical protein